MKPELRVAPEARSETPGGDLAVMLTGGGARAAYQVGLLKGLARHFPDLRFQIITGVSAGAINAVFLASRRGNLAQKVEQLEAFWGELECHHVFRPNYAALLPFRSALRTLLTRPVGKRPHGFFNSAPLAALLRRVFNAPQRGVPIDGIKQNLADGEIRALALITLDYSTGQSVRWVQGRGVDVFEGPNRRSETAQMTLEHVMASAALPFVFPAIRIGSRYHGDGCIRLSAPLSAAVHLGARRILAMSSGYHRTPDEAGTPVVVGYPPAAQIISQLVNAIFLDVIDEDVLRMQRLNEMILKLPPEERDGLKPIDLFVLRPSKDLGKLAGAYEKYLPRSMKFFTRALGSRQTQSPDFVSLLMFEPHFTRMLIEIGEEDVGSRLDELSEFFRPRPKLAAV